MLHLVQATSVSENVAHRQCDVQVMTHRVTVLVRRLVVDRTFRFYAARNAFLTQRILLSALPGCKHSFYAPGQHLRSLEAICSHRHVVLSTKSSDASRGDKDQILIKAKSVDGGTRSESFYITLYTDARRAIPTETWEVTSQHLFA